MSAAAEVLLRTCGGRVILLRMPAPAVQGDLDEQLGLAVPQFQDLELGPVVFRKMRPAVHDGRVDYEVLVSAAAVLGLVGSLTYGPGVGSAGVLFGQALGLVVDGALLTITAMTTAERAGVVVMYRLKCVGALAAVV